MNIEEIPNIKKIAKRYRDLEDLSCCAGSVEDEMILDAGAAELVSVVMLLLDRQPFEDERGEICAELDKIAGMA